MATINPTDYGYGNYQTLLGPGFTQGTNGSAWQTALGDEKSRQLDQARQAVAADIPTIFDTSDTAPEIERVNAARMDLIGADRMLPRAVGEDTPTYAERLRTAWDGPDGWSFAGSHGSLLLALARAGFPTGLAIGAVIIQQTQRYSYLSGTPGNYTVTFGTHNGWTFGSRGPNYWNQFGIMFGADITDLDVGTRKAQILNSIVRAWKPAKARYRGARVVVSGSVWGWPFGVTWGMAGRNWGGVVKYIAP